MTEDPKLAPAADLREIRSLHEQRGKVWLERRADDYLRFYWDDAALFIFDHSLTLEDMRNWLVPFFANGGGPIAVEIPPVRDILLSESGDAATTSYQWKTRSRNAEGVVFDRVNFETDVWYRRNGIWRVIYAHVTNLASKPVE